VDVELLPCNYEPSFEAWFEPYGFERVFLATGVATGGQAFLRVHDGPLPLGTPAHRTLGGNVHAMTNMINIVARGAALGSALGVLFTGVILVGLDSGADRTPALSGSVVTGSAAVHHDDDRWI
jgi:hypothetical protein